MFSHQLTAPKIGNLTYGPLTNDDFVNLTFDARNRLLNAGGVTNLYDAMNNRIGQFHGTNAVQYVVDPNWGLPQTLMSIKNGVTNYYVYGAGLLYQVTETANGETTLTYHYDYRGSTVALTDDSGAVKDRFEYSLYGTMTYRAGTDDTPFLFNGRYGVMTDPNGLLYMRARYYNPYLCRFLNPDPSGFSGGLNFYAYANGNPVSYEDPMGLWAGPDDLAFTGAGAIIGAAGQGIADLVSWHWGGWAQIGRAAAEGAAGGEATLYGGPIAGGAVYEAAKNILDQSSEMATTGNSFNYVQFCEQTTVGALTGAASEHVPLPTIAGLNAGRGSFQAVTSQLVTKLKKGTVQNITWSTAGKMFVSQTYKGLSDATLEGVLEGVNEGTQYNLFGNSDSQSLFTGQTPVDWLGNSISSSSTGKIH